MYALQSVKTDEAVLPYRWRGRTDEKGWERGKKNDLWYMLGDSHAMQGGY
jgi:hypothetical protein